MTHRRRSPTVHADGRDPGLAPVVAMAATAAVKHADHVGLRGSGQQKARPPFVARRA